MSPFQSLPTIILTLLAIVVHFGRAEEGQSGGYFFSFWTDTPGAAQYTNGAGGQYSVTWSGGRGNFVCGKGWQTGSARSISYSADYQPHGNSYLSVYGWTKSPLVEYYITESYGSYNPASAGSRKGTVETDGGTYDISLNVRNNAPSIEGTSTFQQYWSVRTSKRTSGTVTTANHFAAWEKAGMKMGSFAHQIMAVEGYFSSGSASVNVGGGSAGSAPSAGGNSTYSSPETPSPTTGGSGNNRVVANPSTGGGSSSAEGGNNATNISPNNTAPQPPTNSGSQTCLSVQGCTGSQPTQPMQKQPGGNGNGNNFNMPGGGGGSGSSGGVNYTTPQQPSNGFNGPGSGGSNSGYNNQQNKPGKNFNQPGNTGFNQPGSSGFNQPGPGNTYNNTQPFNNNNNNNYNNNYNNNNYNNNNNYKPPNIGNSGNNWGGGGGGGGGSGGGVNTHTGGWPGSIGGNTGNSNNYNNNNFAGGFGGGGGGGFKPPRLGREE